ncbi:MAG: hypothetical protein AAGA30_15940 [Planctomycetota bacterium]
MNNHTTQKDRLTNLNDKMLDEMLAKMYAGEFDAVKFADRFEQKLMTLQLDEMQHEDCDDSSVSKSYPDFFGGMHPWSLAAGILFVITTTSILL